MRPSPAAATDARNDSRPPEQFTSTHDGGLQSSTLNSPAAFPSEAPPTVASSTTPRTWREHLQSAIQSLETEHHTSDEHELRRLEAALHLMYLLAGEEHSALQPLDSFAGSQQQYWRDLIFALSIEMDPNASGGAALKNAQVVTALRNAVNSLAEDSSLAVRNIAFCSSVASYGVYKTFKRNVFRPSQPVLLYFEVENFSSVEEAGGYRTRLLGACTIYDESGKAMTTHEFPPATEVCANRRRDYFIRYEMAIPKDLRPGSYTLQLTVEDEIGRKFKDASIEFQVK